MRILHTHTHTRLPHTTPRIYGLPLPFWLYTYTCVWLYARCHGLLHFAHVRLQFGCGCRTPRFTPRGFGYILRILRTLPTVVTHVAPFTHTHTRFARILPVCIYTFALPYTRCVPLSCIFTRLPSPHHTTHLVFSFFSYIYILFLLDLSFLMDLYHIRFSGFSLRSVLVYAHVVASRSARVSRCCAHLRFSLVLFTHWILGYMPQRCARCRDLSRCTLRCVTFVRYDFAFVDIYAHCWFRYTVVHFTFARTRVRTHHTVVHTRHARSSLRFLSFGYTRLYARLFRGYATFTLRTAFVLSPGYASLISNAHYLVLPVCCGYAFTIIVCCTQYTRVHTDCGSLDFARFVAHVTFYARYPTRCGWIAFTLLCARLLRPHAPVTAAGSRTRLPVYCLATATFPHRAFSLPGSSRLRAIPRLLRLRTRLRFAFYGRCYAVEHTRISGRFARLRYLYCGLRYVTRFTCAAVATHTRVGLYLVPRLPGYGLPLPTPHRLAFTPRLRIAAVYHPAPYTHCLYLRTGWICHYMPVTAVAAAVIRTLRLFARLCYGLVTRVLVTVVTYIGSCLYTVGYGCYTHLRTPFCGCILRPMVYHGSLWIWLHLFALRACCRCTTVRLPRIARCVACRARALPVTHAADYARLLRAFTVAVVTRCTPLSQFARTFAGCWIARIAALAVLRTTHARCCGSFTHLCFWFVAVAARLHARISGLDCHTTTPF